MTDEQKSKPTISETVRALQVAGQILATKANEIVLGTGVTWNEAMAEAVRRLTK